MMSTTEGELDVEIANEREDGELEESDLEEGTYIPLQRPEIFNPPSLMNMKIQDELSDDPSPESSETDSDDELRRRPKRTKLKPIKIATQTEDKRKKYNIWCKTLEEDILTEDMTTCDVSKTKRELGIESYDYNIKYRLENNYSSKKSYSKSNKTRDRYSNKRSDSDRRKGNLRLAKRRDSNDEVQSKQPPRFLGDLKATFDDPFEDIAKEIAEKLYEEKVDLILRIVQILGAKKTIDIYKETQRLEADGGMLIMNGQRRRTSGGIFFFLLKSDDDLPRETINKIFNDDKKETVRRIKQTRAKTRQKVMEQLKQSLNDSELPSLLSRGEATTASTEHGSNPPPSPVTDAKDCSSDTDAQTDTQTSPKKDPRQLQEYEDDDFIEVMCNDDMDLF